MFDTHRKTILLVFFLATTALVLSACGNSGQSEHAANTGHEQSGQSRQTGHDDKHADTDDSSPSHADGNQFGQMSFTARGEKVNCTPSQNGGAFTQDTNGHYILAISCQTANVPEYHQNAISIELAVGGDHLHKGTFHLTPKYMDCVVSTKSCAGMGYAQTLVKGKVTTLQVAEKVLQSAKGTVTITAYKEGKGGMGFASGYVSGTFSFSGTELGGMGQNPGSASGSFEHIPLTIMK